MAFVCEFQHTPLSKIIIFSMFHTSCGMRFCKHVHNSPRDKNKMLHNPYLLEKVVFLAFKTLLSSFGIGEKNFFVNFTRYDLGNGKE